MTLALHTNVNRHSAERLRGPPLHREENHSIMVVCDATKRDHAYSTGLAPGQVYHALIAQFSPTINFVLSYPCLCVALATLLVPLA